MKKLATLFLLMFFANPFFGHSMFMLSIEKGDVYTENYNLGHLLKTTCSSSANNPNKIQPVYGSGQFLSHHHVQLTRYTIAENLNSSTGSVGFSNIDSLPFYSTSSTSIPDPLQKLPSLTRLLKIPITPLLQSSVLLI
jgi:hypothetical protein